MSNWGRKRRHWDDDEAYNHTVVLQNCPVDYTHNTLIELHQATGLSVDAFESSRFYEPYQENAELCMVSLRYADARSAEQAAANLNGQEVAGASGITVMIQAEHKASRGPQEILPSVYLSDLLVEWTEHDLRQFHDEHGLDVQALVTSKFLPSKDASGETCSAIARYANQEAADNAIKILAGKPLTTRSGMRKYVGARHAKPARWMVATGVASEQDANYKRGKKRRTDGWGNEENESWKEPEHISVPKVYDAEIEATLDRWVEAKRARDYETADSIRSELRNLGVQPERARPDDWKQRVQPQAQQDFTSYDESMRRSGKVKTHMPSGESGWAAEDEGPDVYLDRSTMSGHDPGFVGQGQQLEFTAAWDSANNRLEATSWELPVPPISQKLDSFAKKLELDEETVDWLKWLPLGVQDSVVKLYKQPQAARAKEVSSSDKILVTGFPEGLDKDFLDVIFEPFGTVKEFQMAGNEVDQNGGAAKVKVIIQMDSEEEAKTAKEELDGCRPDGLDMDLTAILVRDFAPDASAQAALHPPALRELADKCIAELTRKGGQARANESWWKTPPPPPAAQRWDSSSTPPPPLPNVMPPPVMMAPEGPPPQDMNGELQRGVVKHWNEKKGFGHIYPADHGQELFLHRNQVDPGHVMQEGVEVLYETRWNPSKEKMTITRCMLAAGSEAAGWDTSAPPPGSGASWAGPQSAWGMHPPPYGAAAAPGGPLPHLDYAGFAAANKIEEETMHWLISLPPQVQEIVYHEFSSEAEMKLEGPHDNLYIRDMPSDEESIRELVEPHGQVVSCRIFKGKRDDDFSYAMVRMSSAEEAQAVIEALNGTTPDGLDKPMTVKFANHNINVQKRMNINTKALVAFTNQILHDWERRAPPPPPMWYGQQAPPAPYQQPAAHWVPSTQGAPPPPPPEEEAWDEPQPPEQETWEEPTMQVPPAKPSSSKPSNKPKMTARPPPPSSAKPSQPRQPPPADEEDIADEEPVNPVPKQRRRKPLPPPPSAEEVDFADEEPVKPLPQQKRRRPLPPAAKVDVAEEKPVKPLKKGRPGPSSKPSSRIPIPKARAAEDDVEEAQDDAGDYEESTPKPPVLKPTAKVRAKDTAKSKVAPEPTEPPPWKKRKDAIKHRIVAAVTGDPVEEEEWPETGDAGQEEEWQDEQAEEWQGEEEQWVDSNDGAGAWQYEEGW